MGEEVNNVSCLNSRAIIEYIRRNHPGRLPDLFERLPDRWAEMVGLEGYLSDEVNWIPSSLIVRLFENARRITGDEDAAFKIGFDSIINREFSYWQRIFLRVFSSPRFTLRRLNQLNAKLNSTKIVELVYDTSSHAVVRWHWREGVISSKDVCSYNRGIFSAIPTMMGLPAAKVVENPCTFEGGPYCEVTVTWGRNVSKLKGRFSQVFARKSSLINALEEIERDKLLLRKKFDELAEVNVELIRRVTVLKAINSATRALVSIPDMQQVLQKTMSPIVDVLGFDRAIIMLVDEKRESLQYSYAVGASEEALRRIKDYRIPLAREQNLMIRVLRKKRPILIRDVVAAGLNPTNRILQDFQPSSFIVCPLIAENETIGILGADRRSGQRQLTSTDTEFLSIFANNIATLFQRSRLDEELKSSYVSSVRALVQAIEEKDTYTKGHSERVARTVVAIARELGMSEMEVEYFRLGSLLHDVGKIGISESIVKSRKPLSDADRKIIQKHPIKGVEILQHIPFLRNHMYLIRSHHERWDGKGYPDGLQGQEIPLGARIVAVADVFDAMTSDRPYRKGLPPKRAAREIRDGIGTQFSREAAEAFLAVFERNGSALEEPVPQKS